MIIYQVSGDLFRNTKNNNAWLYVVGSGHVETGDQHQGGNQ